MIDVLARDRRLYLVAAFIFVFAAGYGALLVLWLVLLGFAPRAGRG